MRTPFFKKFFPYAIITVIAITAFCFSTKIRSPYFGLSPVGHHHHLSGSTIVFARNWWNEGMLSSGAKMYDLPKMIQAPEPEDRKPYVSYPSGTVIPYYLLSRLFNVYPTINSVMTFNLANHFLIGLFLAFSVYLFFNTFKYKFYTGIIFSIIPVVITYFMPAPMYFLQNIFFADMGVILPFVLVIFLEQVRIKFTDDIARSLETKKNAFLKIHLLDAAVYFVLFWGLFTDWLFVFVIAVLYFTRCFTGEMGKTFLAFLKKSLIFAIAPILSLGFFLLQVITTPGNTLQEKMEERMGITESDGWAAAFQRYFWEQYMKNGYGADAEAMMKFGLIFTGVIVLLVLTVKVFKKPSFKKSLVSFGTLTIFPCFMQVYALKNHSAVHDFSTTKFLVPISIIPYIFIPFSVLVLLWRIMKYEKTKHIGRLFVSNAVVCVIGIGSLGAASSYTYQVNPQYESFIPVDEPEIKAMGDFIKNSTAYEDVVFSPDFPMLAPQFLIYSEKEVYPDNNINTIRNRIAPVDDRSNVCIIIRNDDPSGLKELIDNSEPQAEDKDGRLLYRWTKSEFLDITEDMH